MNIFASVFMNIFVTNATQSVNWVGTGCAGFPSVLLKRCCCYRRDSNPTPPFLPALLHSTMLPLAQMQTYVMLVGCNAMQLANTKHWTTIE